MKTSIFLIIFLLFKSVLGQNIKDDYSNILLKLDSILVIQSQNPLSSAKYVKVINPEIMLLLKKDGNINEKIALLRKWFKVQERFAWEINNQPHRVKCTDNTCLKFNIINYGKHQTNYHEQFGLDVIEEIKNRKFLNKKYFTCLSADQICNLILMYEDFYHKYTDSEFGLRIWNNYIDLTSIFLSESLFYDVYGEGYGNSLFSDAIKAYKKYLDKSKNENYANVVRMILTKLKKVEQEYFKEETTQDKRKYIYKILNYGNY
ncbi:MAG: hypothetical protein P8Y99_13420 [Calditrichaceae bacterium]